MKLIRAKTKKHEKHGNSSGNGIGETSTLSPQKTSTSTSRAASILSSNETEKLSSSSSAGSAIPRGLLRTMPDFRIFKLDKELKRLKKMEEARLLEESAKWKSGQGPVDPSEERNAADFASFLEEEAESSRTTPKSSPLIDFQSLFHIRRERHVKDASSSSQTTGSQQTSRKGSHTNADRRKSIIGVSAKTRRQSSSVASTIVDFDSAGPKKSHVHTLSSPGYEIHAARYSAEESPLTGPSTTPSFWQVESQSHSESDTAVVTRSPDLNAHDKSGRWSKYTRSQASQDQPGTPPGDTNPGSPKPPKRKRPSLKFSLSDVQPIWPMKKKKNPSEGETPSTASDLATPAYFRRREAAPTEGGNTTPPYFSGAPVHISPSGQFQLYSASPDNSRLPTPPSFHLNRKAKRRGYFGDSHASAGSDEIGGTSPRTEKPSISQSSSAREWSQLSMEDIIQGSDHTNDQRATVRDIPEHLPNSPLCPRHPKHPSGGKGLCLWHRQMSPGVAGTQERFC